MYEIKVLDKTVWTPYLFSFRTTRPDGFRFEAGQFARLGVNPAALRATANSGSDETIFRAYSLVSSPYDDFLEFFSVVAKGGAFTSQLQHLQAGDPLFLEQNAYGFLTLSRYQSPEPSDLWLLATGTGVAPFLSMLQSLELWRRYRRVALAYSVRSASDLAYTEKISRLQSDFAALVDDPARFYFAPIVTQEKTQPLGRRLPDLLRSGALFEAVGFAMRPESSHIMLCGNPNMVEDTKETLKQMGFSMNRRGQGNIAVENYW